MRKIGEGEYIHKGVRYSDPPKLPNGQYDYKALYKEWVETNARRYREALSEREEARRERRARLKRMTVAELLG